MGSNADTGFAKNLASFELMIAYSIGYGAAYQPSKVSLQVPNMQQLLMEARMSLVTVTESGTAYTNARNARRAAFKDLPGIATRVVNALEATDAADKTKEDARGILRKIKGIRASKKEGSTATKEPLSTPATEETATDVSITNGVPTANDAAPRYHSASQTSDDLQIEHFARLLSLLRSEISFTPYEPELQLQSLEQYLETLRMTNSAVMMRQVEWSNARIRRDELMNDPKTGICAMAKGVKQYSKSAFGSSSPKYKQISSLRFKLYK